MITIAAPGLSKVAPLLVLLAASCTAGPPTVMPSATPSVIVSEVGGYRDGRCVETTKTDGSGIITVTGEFGRVGTGPITEHSEYLIAVIRGGARWGEERVFVAERSDLPGKVWIPAIAAGNEWGQVVYRVGLYKPAGPGCWKVRPSGATDADGIVVRIVDLRK